MNRVQVIGTRIEKQAVEKDIKRNADILEANLVQQMNSKQGRWYVWRVLNKLGYNVPITDTNAKVYGETAKQKAAIELANELKCVCRDLFYQMEIENE